LIEVFLIHAVRESVGLMRKKGTVKEHGLYIPDILQYIHKNFAAASLEQAASVFGYTAGYLSSQLKRATGKSFQSLVSEERMREARYLLEYTNLSLDEIRTQLGYSSFSSFSRTFTKNMCISPGRYREKCRVNQ
jgi:AraC-like DNA-binding protein